MKKYTDVDIVAELQKLVDSHVDSYKEDFDIDKRIIRRAAESQNPEDSDFVFQNRAYTYQVSFLPVHRFRFQRPWYLYHLSEV